MLHGRVGALSTLFLGAWAFSAYGQSVISTRSGIVHFFEGAVYVGDQPLEPHLGKFPSVPKGAELRTEQGRAEVLLTPGVFLRLGERSAIRMVANNLADTQVEFQRGSAIVDSAEPNAGTSVTLIYRNWKVHAQKKGVYRIDSDPPRMCVLQGEAEVVTGAEQPVTVDQGMSLPFAGVLVPEPAGVQPADALSEWAKGRSESIVADNAITAQIDEDPSSRASGSLDSFTYFPFLGVPSAGLASSSAYRSYLPNQPGFNSIYLPGYTYRPLLLGLMSRGFRSYVPSTPLRIGAPSIPPRIGISPGSGTGISHPRAPILRPVPVHPAPSMGVRGGVHHR